MIILITFTTVTLMMVRTVISAASTAELNPRITHVGKDKDSIVVGAFFFVLAPDMVVGVGVTT